MKDKELLDRINDSINKEYGLDPRTPISDTQRSLREMVEQSINQYFENLDKMWEQIQSENKDTMQFIKNNSKRITRINDNVDLCRILEISFPNNKGRIHNYADKGIQVYVYK